MVALWTSFTRTGRPTAPGVSSWPSTTATNAPVLQLGNPDVRLIDHRADHQCGFWET